MKLFSLLIFLILRTNSFSHEWIWISGNNESNSVGYYDEMDILDGFFSPGARTNSVSWYDESNKTLWLFGGNGLSNQSITLGCLNDLWSYSIEYDLWEWVSGNKTLGEAGSYGTHLIPSEHTYPGARFGSLSWFDSFNKTLWLFGGLGYDEASDANMLNDVWSFSTELRMWTWVSGNRTIHMDGGYGDLGESSPENFPAGRVGGVSWFDETSQTFWLFGGTGYVNYNLGYLSDLYSFSIDSKNWTWVSGNNTVNVTGNYGNQGESSIDYYPGARENSISWFDKYNRKLWLFGGKGIGESNGYFNDLWSFSFDSKNWTWVSGNNSVNSTGNYGNQGESSIGNYPGGRSESISWFDETKRILWLFGGNYDSLNDNCFDDIWSFSIQKNMWTWVSGSNTSNIRGKYGNKRIISTEYYPGGRSGGMSWFEKTNQTLWIFGGKYNRTEYMNDLWSIKTNQFYPPPSQPPFSYDGIECNTTSCYSDGIIHINESIIVYDPLIITNNSQIVISPSTDITVIINIGENPIIIEGGQIIINFTNENDYEDLIKKIKNNASFEYVLIDGQYNGSFDSISFVKPADSSACETIIPKFKEDQYKTKYSIAFTIDQSSCSKMKWWIILLICLGILIVAIVIFVIIALKNERFRRIILPFRRTHRRESIKAQSSRSNQLYTSKSKVSPIHE